MNRATGLKAGRMPLLLAFVVVLSLGATGALAGQLPAAIPTFDSQLPSPPPNDNFAAATVIASLPYTGDPVDMTYATTEDNEPQYCAWSPRTVWYSFTPTQTIWVHVNMSGLYDVNFSIYRAYGRDITNLSNIFCGEPVSDVDFRAEAGLTYYFQAGKLWDGAGTLQLNVWQPPPPENDDFASAKMVSSLPYGESADARYASTEAGEPAPTCSGSIYNSVWYVFNPDTSGSFTTWIDGGGVLAVYTGSNLTSLTQVACRDFWGSRVTFHGEAGTAYYIQVGSQWDEGRWLDFRLDVTPPPVANFGFNPYDPTIFDTVQFYDNSWDPAEVGIKTRAWDFGDGGTSSDSYPTHQYARDGDYTVNLTVTTADGRTASTSQTVHVATHDVAIVKLVAPNAAHVGQTRPIVVELKNSRYPERVEIQLLKSVPGGFQWVTTTVQNIPVRAGGRTTSVMMSYTFAKEDAMMGKVTFRATASIQNARDALPADNEAISAPTKVTK